LRFREKDKSFGRGFHRKTRPVPGIHLQLYCDERKTAGRGGFAKIFPVHTAGNTPDDSEAGGKGTHQPKTCRSTNDQVVGGD